MARLELLDTTLREGEQCYGVFFPVETKIRLAHLLDEVGVDFIEAGHPAAAPSIRQAVAEIARLDLRAERIAHARLNRDEIKLVSDLGVRWVGLFSGINSMSRARYGLTRRAAFERIVCMIKYAKEIGLLVRFTCEDASRTGAADLVELYGWMKELGVDRISYADTVGADTPERLEQLFHELAGTIPFEALHFHFHDDRGMALANAGKAVELGARCIDTSLLGIGERKGLVRLEDMICRPERGAASSCADLRRDAALASARELVQSSIDLGRFNLRHYAHKSGIHIHGILRDPRQYEPEDPSMKNGRRLIVLSKLIGRSGLRLLIARYGFHADDAGLDALLSRIKSDDRLELANPNDIVRYFQECSECFSPQASCATV
jgi:isopropylmalate/homocitrate/citramalate synthase